MTLTWADYRLQLKETFKIAYGNYTFRDSLTISLSAYGKTGFGECVAVNYYNIDLQLFKLNLEFVKERLRTQQTVHPFEFYRFLLTLQLHPFLRSALDCAYWDLFGKLENKSFAQMLNLSINELPESSLTISVADVKVQVQKIMDSKWNMFKVKCNGLNRKTFLTYWIPVKA